MSVRQKRTAKRVERFWDAKYRAARNQEETAAVVWQHIRATLADRHTTPDAPIWATVTSRLAALLTDITTVTEREVFGNKTSAAPAGGGGLRADAPAGA